MSRAVKLNATQIEQWKKARECVKLGRRGDALLEFQKLLKLAPAHPYILYEAGRAANVANDLDLATRCLQKAAKVAGDDAKLLCSIGRLSMHLRLIDDGLQCFRRALVCDANAIDAIHELVRSYERQGRLDLARETLDPYLQKFPQDLTARYLQALLLQRERQWEKAEVILQEIVRGEVQQSRAYLSCFYLLADILDKSQRPEQAITPLLRVKELVLRNPDFKTTLDHYDLGVAQRNELLASFTPELIRKWQQTEPYHPDDKSVAFLGGHPRSGTTLLERVLDTHPQLTAFDEPDAFYRTVDPFLRRFGPDHAGVSKVTGDYRKHLLRELGGKCESRVWLDKNPSLTACLHSWLRVFPGVKVVIALRHPMDVMLSCFFLDSSMNALSANFLSFERISKHYRDMMDVWLRLRDLGGFEWIESRYEDTVSNVALEGKRVTEFLGLEWQDGQIDFHQKKQQTQVVAPTYHDVTKPVHQRSMQRWLIYESHLSPYLKEMDPYMKQLGYA